MNASDIKSITTKVTKKWTTQRKAEERRRDIVKGVRKRAEEARIAVRNVRRDAMDRLRSGERDGDFSQDESHRAKGQLQQATDGTIARVDEAASTKEEEVMQV